MYHSEPGMYELYKADSGAVRFKVRYPIGMGFGAFTLTSKKDPKKELYQVFFGPTYRFVDLTQNDGQQVSKRFHLSEPIGLEFKEFWLTWHSGVICLGVDVQPEPILTYAADKISTSNIGFIKFYIKSVRWEVEWILEASPVVLKPPKEKYFDDGHPYWLPLDDDHPVVPDGALIGGFEGEPIYIIRSTHNGSLCPGKFVPSKQCGYVAWGGREYAKLRNQILCGYNVKWVNTRGNYIPENAFVAGFSEVRREPLYIGRAMYDNQLLVGKVHTLYSTCYLPYKGKEIEVYEYEILVTTDVKPRAIFGFSNAKKRNTQHVQQQQQPWVMPQVVL